MDYDEDPDPPNRAADQWMERANTLERQRDEALAESKTLKAAITTIRERAIVRSVAYREGREIVFSGFRQIDARVIGGPIGVLNDVVRWCNTYLTDVEIAESNNRIGEHGPELNWRLGRPR